MTKATRTVRSNLTVRVFMQAAGCLYVLGTGIARQPLSLIPISLGSLGTEVDGVLGVLSHALEGLEHQVELADVGPVEPVSYTHLSEDPGDTGFRSEFESEENRALRTGKA